MSDQTVPPSTILTDRDPLGALWRVLASSGMTAALLAALAAAALLILLFSPQQPASTADAGEMARWISDAQARYGSWYETLSALGLLSIGSSVGLWLLLGLGALSLLVRSVDAAARVWEGWRDGEARRPESFYRDLHDPHRWSSPRPRSAAVNRLAEKLAWPAGVPWERLKIRPRREDAGGVSYLRQDLLTRRRAASLGLFVGLLLVLAGLGLDARLGWREEGLLLVPGGAATLETQPDVSLRLDEVVDVDGRSVSRIALESAEGSSRMGTAAVGGPYTARGLTVYQREVGPLLRFSARGTTERGAGAAISLQDASLAGDPVEEMRLVFTESRTERYVVMPYIQKTARLVLYRRGERWAPERDELLIEVYAAGSDVPEARGSLIGGRSMKLGDIVYRFDWERYAVLDVVRSAAHGLVRLGMGLALLGLVAALLLPPLCLWVRVLEEGEGCAVELVGEMPGEPDAVLEASLGAWRRRLMEEREDE
jgi:hypothetical protein